METIPTAEEIYFQSTKCIMNHRDIKTAMIEFAKLHVTEALKQASEKAILITMLKENTDELSMCDDWSYSIVDQTSILNAYSLDNIK